MESSAEMLKKITRQAPDYLPAWGRLAQIAFGEKKYDQSLQEPLLTDAKGALAELHRDSAAVGVR